MKFVTIVAIVVAAICYEMYLDHNQGEVIIKGVCDNVSFTHTVNVGETFKVDC